MRVNDILSLGAARFPENRAVIHGDRSILYGELYEKVCLASEYLNKQDLEPGSRIAILYENSIEYLIFYFAVYKSGMVCVPLDNSLKPDKLNAILKDCGAVGLIFHGKYIRHLTKIVDDNPNIKFGICNKPISLPDLPFTVEIIDKVLESSVKSEPPVSDYSELSNEQMLDKSWDFPNELAAIFYTSGSTGESKGVMLSHRNLCSNTIATVIYLNLVDSDSVMVVLPFYYIYGNSLLLTHVMCGGTLIIDNRFLYPEVILDTMEKEKATGFSGVPSNFNILLNKSTLPERKLEHLRYFTQAGGAMAPEITRRLKDTFPTKDVVVMYGQTEAAPRLTYLPPDHLDEKLGSIGIPLPGIQIKVVDESGNILPVGKSGELITYGPNVMLGYWNQEEATGEVIKDGWLYTGDLAKVDEDGYLFITGRKKEIIKSGGNRVSAKEIEECLMENEMIVEAAVIGVPDDLLGEAIKAYIVKKDGHEFGTTDIQVHCRRTLSEHKIPHKIEYIDALPKMQSGKVDKLKLKEMSK